VNSLWIGGARRSTIANAVRAQSQRGKSPRLLLAAQLEISWDRPNLPSKSKKALEKRINLNKITGPKVGAKWILIVRIKL
jgi:hypothetical protein